MRWVVTLPGARGEAFSAPIKYSQVTDQGAYYFTGCAKH
jgi:hypothetical protein